MSGSEWLNVVATLWFFVSVACGLVSCIGILVAALRKREWDVWVMYLIFSWASAGFATALGLAATS